ncbi:fibronectin type III domain-containing protein [Candidatus Margulisiibacteriota bacterium]
MINFKKYLTGLCLISLLILVLFSNFGCSRLTKTATEDGNDAGSISSFGAPAAPSDFRVNNQDDALLFTWTANQESDLLGYILYYGKSSEQKFLNGINVSKTTGFLIDNLENGTDYSFFLVAYDSDENISPPSTIITATPTDQHGPDDPTDFILKSILNDQNSTVPNYFKLTWKNPVNKDFEGVIVVRKENGFISGPKDGTVIYDGKEEVFEDKTVEMGIMYYYKIFAYDDVPNYSSGDAEKTEKNGILTNVVIIE